MVRRQERIYRPAGRLDSRIIPSPAAKTRLPRKLAKLRLGSAVIGAAFVYGLLVHGLVVDDHGESINVRFFGDSASVAGGKRNSRLAVGVVATG